MSELKPVRCECGKQPALYWTTKRENNRWRVSCDCGRSGPYNYISRDSAVIAWNTRPPAVPVDALEAMRTEIRRFRAAPTGAWLDERIAELIDQARGCGDG